MTDPSPVTAERLRTFLEALGREFRKPARLYLSGGEGLVWRGLRGSTQDVDVTYAVDDRWHGAWIEALRALMLRLGTTVEEAGPGDFIPLPPGAADRAEFIGRFGSVDVFLFDPYSVALSKMELGHQDGHDAALRAVASRAWRRRSTNASTTRSGVTGNSSRSTPMALATAFTSAGGKPASAPSLASLAPNGP